MSLIKDVTEEINDRHLLMCAHCGNLYEPAVPIRDLLDAGRHATPCLNCGKTDLIFLAVENTIPAILEAQSPPVIRLGGIR